MKTLLDTEAKELRIWLELIAPLLHNNSTAYKGADGNWRREDSK